MVVRGAGSALLVSAGVMSIAAASERWWPACRPFGFDHPDCYRLQRDWYDYVAPAEPWVPVGDAAALAAVSLLLQALAVLVVVPALFDRKYRLLAGGVGLAMSVNLLFPAAATWLSAEEGRAVDIPGLSTAMWFWIWGWPIIAFTAIVALSIFTPLGRRDGLRLLVIACLVATAPLVEYFFVMPFFTLYTPYDTTPWTGAVSGVLLVVAGLAFWLAMRPSAWSDELRESPPPLRTIWMRGAT